MRFLGIAFLLLTVFTLVFGLPLPNLQESSDEGKSNSADGSSEENSGSNQSDDSFEVPTTVKINIEKTETPIPANGPKGAKGGNTQPTNNNTITDIPTTVDHTNVTTTDNVPMTNETRDNNKNMVEPSTITPTTTIIAETSSTVAEATTYTAVVKTTSLASVDEAVDETTTFADHHSTTAKSISDSNVAPALLNMLSMMAVVN